MGAGWWLSDNAEAMAKEAGMELTPSDRQTLSEVRNAFQVDASKSAGPLAKLLNSPPLAKLASAIDGWKRKECMKQVPFPQVLALGQSMPHPLPFPPPLLHSLSPPAPSSLSPSCTLLSTLSLSLSLLRSPNFSASLTLSLSLQLAKGAVATPAAFSLPPYDPDGTRAAQGVEEGPAVFDLKKDLPDDFEEKWKKGDYMFKG